mmetsp:Transcript_48026/g.104453  ORF Transcript_48026/g.104453 Transcript_48026/m.104453 type:complete len:249 (-) Transcript_48026:297-1043(-)
MSSFSGFLHKEKSAASKTKIFSKTTKRSFTLNFRTRVWSYDSKKSTAVFEVPFGDLVRVEALPDGKKGIMGGKSFGFEVEVSGGARWVLFADTDDQRGEWLQKFTQAMESRIIVKAKKSVGSSDTASTQGAGDAPDHCGGSSDCMDHASPAASCSPNEQEVERPVGAPRLSMGQLFDAPLEAIACPPTTQAADQVMDAADTDSDDGLPTAWGEGAATARRGTQYADKCQGMSVAERLAALQFSDDEEE